MIKTCFTLIGGTALVVAGTTASSAGSHHRLRQAHPIYGHAHSARRAAAYGDNGAYGYDGSGAIIARATARAQTEPGVTRELAPDAVQTATGGPSGGVPGFSGF